jgi:thiosulfate dehydrogenase [quinone] large subunit
MHNTRALSYAVLRITIGCVFLFFGIGKFVTGVAATAQGFQHAFAKTWLPGFSVYAFAVCLPFLEVTLGALLILGLFTAYVAIGTALLITMLTIGVVVEGNPQSVILNLTCGILVYLLQWRIEDNQFSLDRLRHGQRR